MSKIQVTFKPKSGFFLRGQPMAAETVAIEVEDARKLLKRGEIVPSAELDEAIEAEAKAARARRAKELEEEARELERTKAAIKRADRAAKAKEKEATEDEAEADELPPYDVVEYNGAVQALKNAGLYDGLGSRKKAAVKAAYESLRG